MTATSVVVMVSVIAFVLGFLLHLALEFLQGKQALRKIQEAESKARSLLEEAVKDAETKKKEALVEAKEETYRLRSKAERELQDRRNDIQRLERRVVQQEEKLERKLDSLDQKEKNLQSKEQEISRIKEELLDLQRRQVKELERVSSMTVEEAKESLLKALEHELESETAQTIRKFEETFKEEALKRSRDIVVTAIQRYASDHTAEASVSVVQLPSDDMKGRIIGREGRNIRMLETLTGVDLIVDDTPECVIISGFDPIRREVCRVALEKLISDGRIHPARIEEMVEKAQKDLDARVRDLGEQAAIEAGVTGLHPELVKLIGRLHFRTSYGQNVLKHSLEVAHLAGTMAAELGVSVETAKRAGLLHDIGKAVSADVEGPHALIGGNLAAKYHEAPDVVHGVSGHHFDEEPKTIYPVLVCAADAISASRPGARGESLDAYIKRLEKIEKVANAFDGVEKSYAIQAGREIRVIVKPDEISDEASWRLARDIAKKIEEELEYPGQIKVTIIRETRAIEYAK